MNPFNRYSSRGVDPLEFLDAEAPGEAPPMSKSLEVRKTSNPLSEWPRNPGESILAFVRQSKSQSKLQLLNKCKALARLRKKSIDDTILFLVAIGLTSELGDFSESEKACFFRFLELQEIKSPPSEEQKD